MRTVATTMIAFAFAVIALSAEMSTPARAHAYLVNSFPSSKMHLISPPKTVKLHFSGRADARYSTVSLERDDGAIIVKWTQPKAQPEIAFPAPPLQPGCYHVDYRVLSTDGDLVEGRVDFFIDH